MKLISIGSKDRDGFKECVIDVLGEAFWQRLTDKVGGLDVEIPARVTTLHCDHPLVVALGEDDATELVREFGGEMVSIPKPAWSTSLQLCLAGVREGLNNKEIARRINFTERGVRLALQKAGLKNPNCIGNPALSLAEARKFGLPHAGDTVATPSHGVSHVSNAALTGLAGIHATFSRPAAENRASGL